MSDEEAVRAVGMRVIETWNAHDMKAFAALHADDAELVIVTECGGQAASASRPRTKRPFSAGATSARERCE